MLQDRIKSSRSSTLLPAPKGVNESQRLNPKTQGSASNKTKAKLIATETPLEILNNSMDTAMIFSKTAINVENEASTIKRKNTVPTY